MFYLPLKEADKVKFVRPIELASAQNNVQIPNKLHFPFFISVLLCGLFRRGILCMKIYDYLFVIFILHIFAQKRVQYSSATIYGPCFSKWGAIIKSRFYNMQVNDRYKCPPRPPRCSPKGNPELEVNYWTRWRADKHILITQTKLLPGQSCNRTARLQKVFTENI